MLKTLPPIVAGWCLALLGSPAPAAPDDLFEDNRRVLREGMVAVSDALDDRPGGSPMLDRLRGHLGTLDARAISLLRRAAKEPDAPPANPRRIGVLHMPLDAGTRHVEVVHDPAGDLFARDLSDPDAWLALDWPAIGDVMIDWGAPVPPGPSSPAGEAAEAPLWPGRVRLTDLLISQRYTGPGRSRAASGLPPTQRVLADERIWTRTPRDHDPSRPAGVLVWISPTPAWQPPELFSAADDLGLIVVGAFNNGNERAILDRLQVAFDMLETVRRRHLVDDERVYVTGMSGGGRCASILVACFPEVFRGAVPIVGLNSWHVVRFDDGRYIPRSFAQPRDRVFAMARERRIAAITGDADENQFEMQERARMLAEDGMLVRLDDYPDMGHEMATADRFADAMSWVDEPARSARNAADQLARARLDEHVERFGQGPPASDEARASLVAVTAAGPWSDPAWTAAEWLGYQRPGR